MKNEFLDKGIILPSGEIGKNTINLVARAITQPLAEMVWITTGGDIEIINCLRDYCDKLKKKIGCLRLGEGRTINSNTTEYGLSKESIRRWCWEF